MLKDNIKGIENFIKQQWYIKLTWLRLLYPLSILFLVIIHIRKKILCYRINNRICPPIWIIGNIAVGGSGKSPFIIWLSSFLEENGVNFAVVGHGYKNKLQVNASVCLKGSDPKIFGDEAVMLAQKISAPIIVGKSRKHSLDYIAKNFTDFDLIICDDGLQDYKINRQKEIIIINDYSLGNKNCFPVGPLREPLKRVSQSDLVVTHEYDKKTDMRLEFNEIINIKTGDKLDLDQLNGMNVNALAAIANPDRFFKMIENLGAIVTRRVFPDHSCFTSTDFKFDNNNPILITEKDSVKLEGINTTNIYVVTTKLIVLPRVKDILASYIRELGITST